MNEKRQKKLCLIGQIMFDRSNYDRKSQLAGIRTYLLTPPALQILDMITKFLVLVLVY